MQNTAKNIENTDEPYLIASLPFEGKWLVGYTPAKQIPSHGTNLFGTRYAIDFMAVNDQKKTAPSMSWRTILATESPELFYSFGRPVLSPINGKVIRIHNNETDHEARHSIFSLLPYALGQASRVRMGHNKIAGNYILIKAENCDIFVAIVHLQKDSLLVREGELVSEGQHIANCGNSGNSTEPHIHIQAMDTSDFSMAKGVPLYFKNIIQHEKGKNKTLTNAFPNPDSIVSSE